MFVMTVSKPNWFGLAGVILFTILFAWFCYYSIHTWDPMPRPAWARWNEVMYAVLLLPTFIWLLAKASPRVPR